MTRTKRTSRNTRTRTPRKAANVAGKVVSLKASALSTMNALLKQGAALQRRSRKLVIAKANEARTRTVDAVSHLEKVFEARVSQVISKLGVPTSRDVRARASSPGA